MTLFHLDGVMKKKSVCQSKFDLSKIEEARQLLDTYETSIPNQNKFDETVKQISDLPLFAGMDAGMSKRITKNNAPPSVLVKST